MRFIAAIIIAGCVYSAAHQDDPRATLPELVRRFAPQPVYQSRQLELVLQSIESVLPGAQLVVHGTVEKATTYLSPDQRDLFTDYAIRPIRIISPAKRLSSPKPGAPDALPKEMIVKQWGGKMIIDGVQVTQEDAHLTAFRAGEEVVLLLAYNKGDQKYSLTNPASGAFRVTSTGLQPILKDGVDYEVFNAVRGKSVAQFEALILAISR